MRSFDIYSIATILGLQALSVSCAPSENLQTRASPLFTKTVDCKEWNSPYSCDIFCFAVFCEGMTDVLSHTTDKKKQANSRKESGASLGPFTKDGQRKYGTIIRASDFTWADEYPPASALEGGNGLAPGPRAIVQGATSTDQTNQGSWLNQLWKDPKTGKNVDEAVKIKVAVTNYDPKLSPYCAAMDKGDKSVCKGNKDSPYYRKSDAKGKSNAAVFDHLGA